MKLGYQISEDGRTLWRNNGGAIERRHLYAGTGWEVVADTPQTPRTEAELKNYCILGGYGFQPARKENGE